MARRQALNTSEREETSSLLDALAMAERHDRWEMFEELVRYVEDAGAGLVYLGPGTYAITLHPTPHPTNP